ncbi:TELO2-interacting protein 2 [Thalassophryne amazonica]|uniref:TELO2-interacting protein 2 n=1 Tax=Thalassophryne amazonica TaxID=390379 RepID=UPI0014715896|nr:TELO2-interacting protein 2 [Thalassophryne amazonica]
MDLSSFLQDLSLSLTEKPLPLCSHPPITELLDGLREHLTGATDAELCALIDRVERFFLMGDPHWLFCPPPANQGAEQQQEVGSEGGWAELQGAYVALVDALARCAALPLCHEDSGSLPTADYKTIPERVIALSSALKALLEALAERERGCGADREQQHKLLLAVAPQICVFAVTHDQVQNWTNQKSRQAAQSLQGALLWAGHWRDSAHLLIGDERREEEGGQEKIQGILGGILDILQPQLTKDTWWHCEAVKLVFAWTLLQVTRPSLSSHLPRLLPPALLLNDHYRRENCMLGIRCLHHIVVNTAAAELRQLNRASVVYEALFKHLYTTDAAVIQLTLSSLLDILLVLEKPPLSLSPASCRRRPCRHDDVLRLILTHMEAEHKVELRRVYAVALPQYIHRMGVAVCRHLKRLERVVLRYLEVEDPPEEHNRLKVLEVLQETLITAWPR